MSQVKIHPSATVVVLREAPGRLETLLLLRNEGVKFGGGEWVFPGGKIEASELDAHAQLFDAERAAAVRECMEEAGIALDPAALAKYSHWVTPDIMPRRFSTGFYVAQVEPHVPVQIDNGEIVDHRWLSPGEALDLHRAGNLPMMPPTFVSLCDLAQFGSAAELAHRCSAREPMLFEPLAFREEGGACLLYAGDSGYANADPAAPGPRHRLLMRASGYEYICELEQ